MPFMCSSNMDAISALVQQNVIMESDGFDYTGHEFEPLFNYVFHFASDDLLGSANSGASISIGFLYIPHLIFMRWRPGRRGTSRFQKAL